MRKFAALLGVLVLCTTNAFAQTSYPENSDATIVGQLPLADGELIYESGNSEPILFKSKDRNSTSTEIFILRTASGGTQYQLNDQVIAITENVMTENQVNTLAAEAVLQNAIEIGSLLPPPGGIGSIQTTVWLDACSRTFQVDWYQPNTAPAVHLLPEYSQYCPETPSYTFD